MRCHYLIVAMISMLVVTAKMRRGFGRSGDRTEPAVHLRRLRVVPGLLSSALRAGTSITGRALGAAGRASCGHPGR